MASQTQSADREILCPYCSTIFLIKTKWRSTEIMCGTCGQIVDLTRFQTKDTPNSAALKRTKVAPKLNNNSARNWLRGRMNIVPMTGRSKIGSKKPVKLPSLTGVSNVVDSDDEDPNPDVEEKVEKVEKVEKSKVKKVEKVAKPKNEKSEKIEEQQEDPRLAFDARKVMPKPHTLRKDHVEIRPDKSVMESEHRDSSHYTDSDHSDQNDEESGVIKPRRGRNPKKGRKIIKTKKSEPIKKTMEQKEEKVEPLKKYKQHSFSTKVHQIYERPQDDDSDEWQEIEVMDEQQEVTVMKPKGSAQRDVTKDKVEAVEMEQSNESTGSKRKTAGRRKVKPKKRTKGKRRGIK